MTTESAPGQPVTAAPSHPSLPSNPARSAARRFLLRLFSPGFDGDIATILALLGVAGLVFVTVLLFGGCCADSLAPRCDPCRPVAPVLAPSAPATDTACAHCEGGHCPAPRPAERRPKVLGDGPGAFSTEGEQQGR